jgi:hypothetical protein
MRIGELLFEAREIDPGGFVEWVDKRLPFGIDKAKRMIAIHLAYKELPADIQAQLPRPWQALFALRRWTGGRLQDAIGSGEIGSDTTVADALKIANKWSKDTKGESELISARYGRADNVAGKLMVFPASELNPDVARALRVWLERPVLGLS